MNKKELKEKSVEELIVERDKAKKKLTEFNFKKVVSVVDNPVQVRGMKKDIARINTILHEREIEKIKSEINKLEK